MLSRFTEWFVNRFVKRVRFWEEKEWRQRTPKERIWIWYKHHWKMKNEGSSEVDQITDPIKEVVLYGGIITLTLNSFLLAQGISVNFIELTNLVYLGAMVLWLILFGVQWWIGNWKDKQDFIALNMELENRRNKVFREMRGGKLEFKVKK